MTLLTFGRKLAAAGMLGALLGGVLSLAGYLGGMDRAWNWGIALAGCGVFCLWLGMALVFRKSSGVRIPLSGDPGSPPRTTLRP